MGNNHFFRPGLRVRALSALIGFSYGVVLLFISILAAGAGHGTYVLMGFASAPLGLAENVLIALVGMPFLWCLLSFLASSARHRVWLAFFLVAMAIHYASLYPILSDRTHFGDWSYIPKVAEVFWPGLVVYGAGQVALWVLCLFQLWCRRYRLTPKG
jgi:hypothetical protein